MKPFGGRESARGPVKQQKLRSTITSCRAAETGQDQVLPALVEILTFWPAQTQIVLSLTSSATPPVVTCDAGAQRVGPRDSSPSLAVSDRTEMPAHLVEVPAIQ